jgi:YggT family protein
MTSLLAGVAYGAALAPASALAAQSALGSIAEILILVLTVLNILIFIRALLSWFMPVGRDPLSRLLVDVTEPVLAPVRELVGRIMPSMGIDLSPIIALVLIQWVLIPLLGSIR